MTDKSLRAVFHSTKRYTLKNIFRGAVICILATSCAHRSLIDVERGQILSVVAAFYDLNAQQKYHEVDSLFLPRGTIAQLHEVG